VKAGKPFFMYACLTQPHLPTLPNLAFAGKLADKAATMAAVLVR